MKNFVQTLSILLMVVLLCGCNSKPDAKVAELETKITALESNIADLYERNEFRRQDETNIMIVVSNVALSVLMQTNLFEVTQIQLQKQDGKLDAFSSAFSNFLLNAHPPATTSGRMPPSVAAQIKAKAAQRWPGDYQMQETEIRSQTEAWYNLNR